MQVNHFQNEISFNEVPQALAYLINKLADSLQQSSETRP